MIPLARDTRDAIGAFAEKVQNRALLFEKMVLAKHWGHDVERLNDANRFNVLRACSSGGQLLAEDRDSALRKANSPRSRDHVRSDAAYKARVAGALATVNVLNPDLARRQAENGLNLLSLLEQSYAGRSHTFVGELGGRLLINMAGGVQENAGLALDRCFGLPYIPGSAVKGVARRSALWDIRQTTGVEERKRKLRLALLAFGFIGQDIGPRGDFAWAAGGDENLVSAAGMPYTRSDSFKGMLSFLPAQPVAVPEIMAEVLTPHPRAAQAAQGKGDPRPLFFPAVREGSSFGFAVIASWLPEKAPVAEVLEQAGTWLRSAITGEGVGAKTGAGYGWFVIDPAAEERRRQAMAELNEKARAARQKAAEAAAAEKAELERRATLRPEQVEAEAVQKLDQQAFAEWAKSLPEKTIVQQTAFLQVLKSSDHKETRKRWKKNKPEIWKAIQQVAASLNIPLE